MSESHLAYTDVHDDTPYIHIDSSIHIESSIQTVVYKKCTQKYMQGSGLSLWSKYNKKYMYMSAEDDIIVYFDREKREGEMQVVRGYQFIHNITGVVGEYKDNRTKLAIVSDSIMCVLRFEREEEKLRVERMLAKSLQDRRGGASRIPYHIEVLEGKILRKGYIEKVGRRREEEGDTHLYERLISNYREYLDARMGEEGHIDGWSVFYKMNKTKDRLLVYTIQSLVESRRV